jgi:hypothetical protein
MEPAMYTARATAIVAAMVFATLAAGPASAQTQLTKPQYMLRRLPALGKQSP